MTKKAFTIAVLNWLLRAAFVASPRLYRRAPLRNLEPRRVLVARPDHIGDAVLATPTIRAVRRRFPEAHVTLAVASWSAPLFQHPGDADDVFIIDPPWWIAKRGGRSGIVDRMRAWGKFLAGLMELRRRRFDLCLELRGDVRQIIAFGWFIRAGAIVAYRRNGGHFLTDGWLLPGGDRHESLQGLDLAALVGCDDADPVPRIVIGPAASASVEELLRRHGVSDDNILVVIHPSAKRANSWPPSHFKEILAYMMGNPAIQVMLTGARSDRSLHADLETVAPQRIRSCAGQSLLDVAALIARADLFVTADTGPMHLLNGTSTPSVLLFGPTRPERFAPFGKNHRILRAGWCCSEELHDVCLLDPSAGAGRCMEALGTDRVVDAVRDAIGKIEHARHARLQPSGPAVS